MNPSKPSTQPPADEWASRRAGNARLGWILGAVVLGLFLLAIWTYRPI